MEENKNIRNAGRRAYYKEPTESVAFRVPASKVQEFKEYANKFLHKLKVEKKDTKDVDALVIPNKKPEPTRKTKEKFKGIPESEIFGERSNAFENVSNINKCDCKLDGNGLLRRGKTPCKKSKAEHNF